MGALCGRACAAPERTVLRDACRDERVRHLQQDRARPAQDHEALAVQLPRYDWNTQFNLYS
jgi:hypothetical protein